MKTNTVIIKLLVLLVVILSQVSCNEYLDILPKGQKIPTTLADFEALLREEFTVHTINVAEAINLLNDRYQTVANLNYYPLTKANYMWNESADRIYLSKANYTLYDNAYTAIATCNVILEYVLS
ncbi:MAG: RagB/SusD family nutrient uptake outer membrane protein [Prevotellaceae bacterium]|jgi:hypothetical protein|nr:RagB/SusD family nutrient uptake outer membrane protein [Prevotellaceae bacterium]